MGNSDQSSNPVEYKSPAELELMRSAGRLLGTIMEEIRLNVKPGVTTMDLDKLAYDRIRQAGAVPAFLNLYGFPNTLCTSLNDAVVHGIPNRKPLRDGDIISIDCGLILGGFYADMAFTAGIGEISESAEKLLSATKTALYAGINAFQPGVRIGQIGKAIYEIAEESELGVVMEYTGHGIGRHLHEEPKVFNSLYVDGLPRLGKKAKPGLVLAIEPMFNLGTGNVMTLDDEWTVVSADRSLSAHFEHTVALTEAGPEILTLSESEVASAKVS